MQRFDCSSEAAARWLPLAREALEWRTQYLVLPQLLFRGRCRCSAWTALENLLHVSSRALSAGAVFDWQVLRCSGAYLTRAWSPWVAARFCVAGAALRAPRAAVGCCALGRLGPRRVSAWQETSIFPHIFVWGFCFYMCIPPLPSIPCNSHTSKTQLKLTHTPTCAIQFTQLDSHHPTHTTQPPNSTPTTQVTQLALPHLLLRGRCRALTGTPLARRTFGLQAAGVWSFDRARSPVGRKHFGLQSLFPVEYLVPPQLLLCGRCSALIALVPRAFCVAGAMASSWCLCSCFCMTGAAPSALSMELLFCVENLLRAWLPCIPARFSVAGAALCAPLAR